MYNQLYHFYIINNVGVVTFEETTSTSDPTSTSTSDPGYSSTPNIETIEIDYSEKLNSIDSHLESIEYITSGIILFIGVAVGVYIIHDLFRRF